MGCFRALSRIWCRPVSALSAVLNDFHHQKRCILEVLVSTIPGLEVLKVYNRHPSQQTVFCVASIFKVKIDYYYILACHIVILLYLRTFCLF